MNLKNFLFAILLTSMVLHCPTAQATHIRAGEITAVRISGLTYRFTALMYFDTFPGNADSQDITVDFGTGEAPQTFARTDSFIVAGVEYTSVNLYTFEFTFPAPGNYRIFYTVNNRNDGITNINNGASKQTPFSVETILSISPVLGPNSTPNFTIAPVDQACVGQRFTHNSGAFDIDGDSLAYRIVVPKESGELEVNNYRPPNDPVFGLGTEADSTQAAEYRIDPITGTLTWDAPSRAGEYNIAFVVEEWRRGVLIGQVVRDMQILVSDCNNRRPDVKPLSLCVVANEIDNRIDSSNVIFEPIIATDPDGDMVNISVTNVIATNQQDTIRQGIFDPNIFDITAQLFPTQKINDTTFSAIFRWDTRCEHVREQPYFLAIRAEDEPLRGPGAIVKPLVDVETWQIQVKGPPPLGLNAQLLDRTALLTWQDYRRQCPEFTPFELSTMEIIVWRKEGCGQKVMCEQSPEMFGYTQIGRLALNDTSFRDIGPLSRGLSYSYVLTVNFPEPTRGTSLASQETCVSLPLTAPLITQVSVDQTGAGNGQISVNWVFPPELDTSLDPGPFTYFLERADDIGGTNFSPLVRNTPDTSFVDTGLDTENRAYTYRVTLLSQGGSDTLQQSDPASSVRLRATPSENSIVLTWDYQVPWSNNSIPDRSVPGHIIYRKAGNESQFVAIDTVFIGNPTYVDYGTFGNLCLDPNQLYEYRVTTIGSYYNDLLMPRLDALDRPLFNDSQESSPQSPLNVVPPSPPLLMIESPNCTVLQDKRCVDALSETFSQDLQNQLFWSSAPNTEDSPCLDIASYQLFFRPLGQSNYDLGRPLYQGADTSFKHIDLPRTSQGLLSQAGCYLLLAIDQNGNVSSESNEVCQDNCLYYELPNVITPDNLDGANDVFQPCQDPLYAEQLELEVFNRWGNRVFSYQGDPHFTWNAKNEEGNKIPTGVYYYAAKVHFLSIHPEQSIQVLKGWLHVVRTDGPNIE